MIHNFKQYLRESNLDSELRKLGLKRGSKGYPIGKVIGGSVYVERGYAHQFPEETFKPAEEVFYEQFPDQEYKVVKYDPKTSTYSFIFSSDFDTNPEPSVEGGITVKKDGTFKKFKDAGWIYHHKWQWVGDDYDGFDVEKEKERSLKWSSLPDVDKSRIGQRKFWDTNVIPRLKD